MAFETNKEAAEWKAAIEARIRHVSESRRPMLPDSVNAQTISAILDLGSCTDSVWKRVAVYEGVCVLEHITFERKGNSSYKYHPMMDLQVRGGETILFAYLSGLKMLRFVCEMYKKLYILSLSLSFCLLFRIKVPSTRT